MTLASQHSRGRSPKAADLARVDEADIRIWAEDLLAVRSHFGLPTEAARKIVDEVTNALETWRAVARATGISRPEQERVGSAIRLPTSKAQGRI